LAKVANHELPNFSHSNTWADDLGKISDACFKCQYACDMWQSFSRELFYSTVTTHICVSSNTSNFAIQSQQKMDPNLDSIQIFPFSLYCQYTSVFARNKPYTLDWRIQNFIVWRKLFPIFLSFFGYGAYNIKSRSIQFPFPSYHPVVYSYNHIPNFRLSNQDDIKFVEQNFASIAKCFRFVWICERSQRILTRTEPP
jgi:hypothetical protein